MFKLMWKIGYTPNDWKTAEITLFLKKEPSYLPSNHRPIAVHITIYKLWTRLITEIAQSYIEAHNLLSFSQEGFRPNRSTAHAIQLLTLALEDARNFNKDIFVTKLDFASAYNCVNHDKLFYIMESLGFPHDIINIIKSLYTDASTILLTPIGTSSAIPQSSGVIQGDTLSPLLFNIAIEPLLQWLHSSQNISNPLFAKGYHLAQWINTQKSPCPAST